MSTYRKQQKPFILLLIFPLLILFVLEIIQRFDVYLTLIWMYENSLTFLINYILVLSIVSFSSSVFSSWFLGNMVSALTLWLLSIVSSYKLFFLNEPLFPWDITMYRYAIELMPLLTNQTGLWAIVVLILFCIVLYFILNPLKSLKMPYRIRLGIAIPSIVILAAILSFTSSPAKTILDKVNIQNMYWVQNENYKKNGFLLSFLMNFQSAIVLPPEGYSIQAVNSIRLLENPSRLPNRENSGRGGDIRSAVKPNVIVIMSEAFWDPTKIESLSFSEDPLSTVRTLQRTHPDAELLSPVFGGMTANVEFEVLTGLSTALLPQGSIPYQQYVKSELPGLPRLFKAYGYRTLAIHPYHKWFYRRNEVYPLLGFEQFEGLEDFQAPLIKGQFVSDLEVTKKIIKNIREIEAPIFLYAISMQNHGPYEPNRYETTNIKIKGQISRDLIEMLSSYTEGVRDADIALRALIEQLESQSEPTIVMFFGDHLPLLGKEYHLYKESGFISSSSQSRWTLDETIKMKRVPLIMWSNFTLKHGDLGILSPTMLGPILLEDANIPITDHFALLSKLSKIAPGFSTNLFVDTKGLPYKTLPVEANKIMHQYHLLHYNLLFDYPYPEH